MSEDKRTESDRIGAAATIEEKISILVPALSPPSDGATARDQLSNLWIACCGVWWSETAWLPPREAIDVDAEAASRLYKIMTPGRLNCPRCSRSLRRHEPDSVSTENVLSIADRVDAAAAEQAFARRLTDVEEGEWVRFGPMRVGPRASERIPAMNYGEPLEIAYLSLPSEIAPLVRVLDVKISMHCYVDGPVQGECFAVRIPADSRRPIDRGGSLSRRGMIYPNHTAFVFIENKTDQEIEVYGALFAPKKAEEIVPVASGC